MEAIRNLYIFAGLLLAGLAVPLILERVNPNPFYGFRVKETLENEAVWYAVNKHAGKRMVFTGLVTAAAAIVFPLISGISIDAYAYLCLAVFVCAFLPGMVQSWRYMTTLAKELSTRKPTH